MTKSDAKRLGDKLLKVVCRPVPAFLYQKLTGAQGYITHCSSDRLPFTTACFYQLTSDKQKKKAKEDFTYNAVSTPSQLQQASLPEKATPPLVPPPRPSTAVVPNTALISPQNNSTPQIGVGPPPPIPNNAPKVPPFAPREPSVNSANNQFGYSTPSTVLDDYSQASFLEDAESRLESNSEYTDNNSNSNNYNINMCQFSNSASSGAQSANPLAQAYASLCQDKGLDSDTDFFLRMYEAIENEFSDKNSLNSGPVAEKPNWDLHLSSTPSVALGTESSAS